MILKQMIHRCAGSESSDTRANMPGHQLRSMVPKLYAAIVNRGLRSREVINLFHVSIAARFSGMYVQRS